MWGVEDMDQLTGWQPIETAPRDGRRVFAIDAAKQYMTVGFINSDGEFEQVDMIGNPMGIGFYPTHWAQPKSPPNPA